MSAPTQRPASSSLLLLKAASALLMLLAAGCVALVFTSGEALRLEAVATGQHVIIDVKSGKATGAMRSLKPAETQAASSDIPAAATGKPTFDVADGTEATTTTTTSEQPAPDMKDGLVATEEESAATISIHPRTAISLPAAPVEGLIEQTPAGLLPRKKGDLTPFEAYRRPVAAASNMPRVALVVQDVGGRIETTEQAIALPSDITLALSPYSPHAKQWAESARNMGHEIWLMLPVQPQGFPANDPGPKSLLVGLSEQENIDRLQQTLASSVGYAGVCLAPNENFSDQPAKLEAAILSLEARGLGVLASRLVEKTQALALLNAPHKHRRIADRLIDTTLTETAIASELAKLEAIAREKGASVGVVRAYPLSLKMVASWAEGLKGRGVALVPLSATLTPAAKAE